MTPEPLNAGDSTVANAIQSEKEENPGTAMEKADKGPSVIDEFIGIWKALPHKTLFLVLLGAWLWIFEHYGNATFGYVRTHSLFTWMKSIYLVFTDESHGFYIPYLVILFLWIRRRELALVKARIWWPGLFYLGLAMATHFMAYRIQQGRISVLALVLGIHALIGIVWGPDALRRTIFPVFLLLFCMPLGALGEGLTFNLRILVTKISVGISHDLLGISAFRSGSQILDGTGKPLYDVAPACSGIRSLTVMAAVAVIAAFLNLRTVWRRVVVILGALPLAVIANILRITTVIIVGDVFGPAAGVMIEQKFGFVTFAIAIGGVMLLCHLLEEREKPMEGADIRSVEPSANVGFGSAIPIGVAALALMAAGLFALQNGKARLGNPGLVMESGTLTNETGKVVREQRVRFPDQVANYQSMEGPISKWEEESLPRDTSFGRRIYWQESGIPVQLSAVMMKTDRTSIHRPQTCIIGQGWRIDETKTITLPIAKPHSYNLNATCMMLTRQIQDANGRMQRLRGIYIYWFVAENRLAAGHSEALWQITRDLLTTGTMYPWAYVSCFAYCHPGEEEALLGQMKALISGATPEFQITTGDPKQTALLKGANSLE